jgi:hypothetical protein
MYVLAIKIIITQNFPDIRFYNFEESGEVILPSPLPLTGPYKTTWLFFFLEKGMEIDVK